MGDGILGDSFERILGGGLKSAKFKENHSKKVYIA